uniref:Uncharacterized protein n=1 Tax=Burkholderia sp. (strain CCGE1003) TaxID=640512 RepID=E1TAM9_BURSG
MSQSLHIALDRQGADVVKQSPVPITHSGVDGLRMYDAGTPFKALGAMVVLDDDYHPISFPPVEHLAFYEEGATGGGINEIAMDLWLPRKPKSYSDAHAWTEYDKVVRKLAQETIDRINQAHWQRWIMFYDPRLSGRDTIAFAAGYRNRGYTAPGQDMWGVDPLYRMTQEDWSNLPEKTTCWTWIKNGASIQLRYEKESRNPRMPILFDTLRVTIKSADTTSGGFYGETKGDWKQFKQSEMQSMFEERKQKEEAAKSAGARILEDYKDYPVGGVTLPDTAR